MSKLRGEVLTLPKMSGSVSAPKPMSGNVGAKTINIGGNGEDGATFIPSVSEDGVISWTNDKELPNPAPVNIKGEKGDTGEPGKDGFSPVVAVEDIDGGHRVSITDKDGAKTFDVMDGKDGQGGAVSWNDLMPIFNLAEMGMPTHTVGGETTDLVADVSHIIEAMRKGIVGFIIPTNYGNATVYAPTMEAVGMPEAVCAFWLSTPFGVAWGDVAIACTSNSRLRVASMLRTTEEQLTTLINNALGVIENGTY